MRYNNYHKHDHKGNVRTIDTITKLEDYCKRAKELGHTTIFTTNHGMQGDIFEATTLAEQYDLKLIVGCECYYVNDRFSKDKSNRHLIVIALNDNGVKRLNKILTIANKEGFYYKPRIDHELLMSLNPNDFVITSACVAGILNDENLVKELSDKFKEHFFLEVQNHNQDIQKEWNKKALYFKDKYNIGLIHGNDSHYILPEDSKYRDLFLKAKGYNYENEDNFILDYPDSDEIIKRYKKQDILSENEIMEALNNTLIFDKAEKLTLINDEIKLPKVSDNPNRELNEIIVKEWNKEKKNIPKEKHKEYLDAIKYEMKIIKDTHMENYFILDYKMVKLGQEKYGGMITKSGRGSCVSFIVNKLLGLTNIDRLDSCIKLFPTRFMSTARILQTRSLPDVDVNTVSRYPFIKATEELLGKEHCAWMLSWKPLQESSAFRLYCKSLDMPPSSYNEVAKDLDNYRNNSEWKDIIKESERFVGVVETMSESPCSMLIYDKNIEEEIGLIRLKDDSGEDKYCCLLDGYNCDKYKYLKNDLLQVSVWGIIKETFDLIDKPVPTIKEFESLLNDKTWEIYEKGLTSTINQVDSEWATDLVKRYKPRTISEMSSFVAAIRPGFASLLDNFIDRKPYTTGVKELDDLLEDSFHYLLYQESIMKYLVWLGIDESETYDIIKKISKKKFKEKELKELKEKLIRGWVKRIGSKEGFEKTWQVIEDAAHYSFNASHSLSYAYDSLYVAYLKGNYPLEYYTVALNYYIGDDKRTSRLIKEMEYFNIKINQPKFRYSKAKYMCDKENNSIYKGIESVKYLNEEVSDELYNEYKDKKFNSFVELIHTLKNETSITTRQFEILIYLNYFSEFGKNKKLLTIFEKYIDKLKNKNLKQETKDKRLLELIEFEKTVENRAVDIKAQIEKEIEYLGYEVTRKESLPSNIYIISDINDKSTPKLRLYCLKNGEVENVKCYKKTIKQNPFGKFSVIKKKSYKQVPKNKLNENGEWVKSDTEFECILTDYEVIM